MRAWRTLSPVSITWVRREHVLSREALGEVVLLAPDGDEPIALADPADAVWHLLATPQRLDDLVAELADGTHPEVVRDAIDGVLQRLLRAGLVSCVADEGSPASGG
jgi:hypothetical protein